MSFKYDNRGETSTYAGKNFPTSAEPSGLKPKYEIDNNIIGGYLDLSVQSTEFGRNWYGFFKQTF